MAPGCLTTRLLNSTQRHVRSACRWKAATRSRRVRSCLRPATSCLQSFSRLSIRSPRAGLSLPSHSRKTSGKAAALIWEDSTNYLYARATQAGRIIIGGEDSDQVTEPEARDRLIPEKARTLANKLTALWPVANTETEFRWSGTFDRTTDGLPLIGPIPGMKNIYAAYGYGGNGITFSFLAAQLIGGLIAGSSTPLLSDFAIDRDGSSSQS